MTVPALTSTEAIDLDLSGLTSVLAVVLAIGSVLMLVWMWRIGQRLEGVTETPDESGRPVDSGADAPPR